MKTYTCDWCKQADLPLTQAAEMHHLYNCEPFQGAVTAEIKNGKEFIQVPDAPHILVERFPRRLN